MSSLADENAIGTSTFAFIRLIYSSDAYSAVHATSPPTLALRVPDHLGRTVFAAMMNRRHEARYFGFDLLSLNGEDLRQLPLLAGSNDCFPGADFQTGRPSRFAEHLYAARTNQQDIEIRDLNGAYSTNRRPVIEFYTPTKLPRVSH